MCTQQGTCAQLNADLLTARCYQGIAMPHGQTLPSASMAHIEHVLLLCICRTENMTEAHMWTALDSSGNENHLPLVTPPQPAPVTIRQVF